MSRHFRTFILAAAVPAAVSALLAACSSDSTSSSTSTTGSGGSGTTTTGSTTTGASGSTTTGAGGASTSSGTTTGSSMTTGVGGSTSTTTGASGSTSTASTGSGGPCPPSCTGSLEWAKAYGGAGNEQGNAVVADSMGNVIVGGEFGSPMNLGCGMLMPGSGDTPFVAELDPSGNCLWNRAGVTNLPVNTTSQIKGVAADAMGNVYVTGLFFGTLNLGGGTLTSTGQSDLFLAKFDAAGNHVWSVNYGDLTVQTARAIAVDSAGHVVIAGDFQGTINFGGGGQISSAGGLDAFVAAFDNAGTPLWSKRYGDVADQSAQDLAIDGNNDVIVTGKFGGVTDFGGGPLATAGSNDVFVVKLDAMGAFKWAKRYGAAGDDVGSGVAADAMGNVVVTGYFSDNAVTFGAVSLTNKGGKDAFLAKLDGTGADLWSKGFGDAATQNGNSVAVDASGNVSFGGYLGGSADFGGGVLTASGGSSAFVAKFDASGAHLWSKAAGGGGMSLAFPRAVAADPSGAVLVTGLISAPTNFGGGNIGGFGAEDAFVEKLAP